jgi:hypothetical protein
MKNPDYPAWTYFIRNPRPGEGGPPATSGVNSPPARSVATRWAMARSPVRQRSYLKRAASFVALWVFLFLFS